MSLAQFADQVIARTEAMQRGGTVLNYENLRKTHLDDIGHIPLTKPTPVILNG
jgi:hypothetical protein